MKIAITGKPGIGKSTICKKVIESLDCKKGGMLCSDIRKNRKRIGFEIKDILTGKKGILAHVKGSGPKVGKYHVNLKDLNEIGVKAIENAINSDLIIIDEIAPMELKSKDFIRAVESAIDSEKSMLVVLHQTSRHKLAERIRLEFKVITVNEENRDGIANEIIAILSSANLLGIRY